MGKTRTNTGSFSGAMYTSATLTTTPGNTGWVEWPMYPVRAGFLRLAPANLATDETLDLVMSVAFNSSGDGEVVLHTFTQVTSTNVAENLTLPGGETGDILAAANESVGTPLPEYYKLVWTLGGTTKSMNFVLYAALVG